MYLLFFSFLLAVHQTELFYGDVVFMGCLVMVWELSFFFSSSSLSSCSRRRGGGLREWMKGRVAKEGNVD